MTSTVSNSFSKVALLLQFGRNNVELKYKIEKLKVKQLHSFYNNKGQKLRHC